MEFRAPVVLLGCLLLLFALPVTGAEWRLEPVLTVSELWTDNLYNEERAEESEFVTRLIPSFALDYEGPRVTLDLGYTLDYRYYLKGERGDEAVHFLDLRSLLNYKEKVYLEVIEEFARVSLDSTRDYRDESLFENQSDRNLFSISPYLEFRTSPRSTFKGGYRYAKIDYEERTASDKEDSIIFIEGTYELSDRMMARAGYNFIDEQSSEEDEDHQKQDVFAGLRWQVGKNSSAFGTVGYTWIEFDDGPQRNDFFWDFGISHDFGILVATAAVGVTYLEDPEEIILRQENYRFSVSRDWSRSRLSATVYFSDFYDVAIDKLDIRRYGASSTLHHEFSDRWNGSVTLSAAKWEDKFEDTWTRRLIGSLGLSYLFAEDLTATLSYYRIDSHSPEQPEDRYETNQIIVEARKVF